MSDDKTDKFADKMAEFVSRPADSSDKPQSDEKLDPVLQQQQREIQAEAERKAHLRAIDPNIPEHLLDAAFIENDLLNTVAKGDYVDLIGKVPGLKVIYIGAGWSPRALDEMIDVDMSIFLLDRKDMTRQDSDFVFYNNLQTCDGGVRHEGDNRDGAGEGGDEEGIIVDLNSVPFDIVKIMIVFSIYDEADNQGHLGLMRSLYVRLVNKEYNEEICRFMIPEDGLDKHSGMYVGTLEREGPRWFFRTMAEGRGRGGLAKLAAGYGIIIKELQSTEN